jgi:hypothetical protein
MQQRNGVWLWSDSFTGVLHRLMQELEPEQGVAWLYWARRWERLECWRQQVNEAQELYRQGHKQVLRLLCDYWRNIAEDVLEQARIASETYRELSPQGERLEKDRQYLWHRETHNPVAEGAISLRRLDALELPVHSSRILQPHLPHA